MGKESGIRGIWLYDVYENGVLVGEMTARDIMERYMDGERLAPKRLKEIGVEARPNGRILPIGELRMPYHWCREWDKARMAILKFKKEAGGNGQKS